MIAALREAGFPGVEEAEGLIYARLSASGAEFTAVAEAGAWRLALCWPVRATAAQMAGFMAAHPGAQMDLFLGETRLSMLCVPKDLARWAAVAEAAVVAMTRWRRRQRAPGEGM